MAWNRTALQKVQRAAVAGIAAGADVWFAATQQAVPVDTGDLKRSGRVVVFPEVLTAEVRYGDGLGDGRAVIVHEKTEIHHRGRTRAKYLEQPGIANRAAIERAVANKLRRAIK